MRVFSQINNCQQKQNKTKNKTKQKTDRTKRGAPLLGLAKYILLDGLVCSIVGYFYESRRILASP